MNNISLGEICSGHPFTRDSDGDAKQTARPLQNPRARHDIGSGHTTPGVPPGMQRKTSAMKTRQEHKQAIKALLETGEDAQKTVKDYAEAEFRKAREDGNVTAKEAKDMLHELLMGAEEALGETGFETKIIIRDTINAFIFVFGDILEQTWEALVSYAKSLRDLIEKAGELGKEGMENLEKLIREHEDGGKKSG